MKKVLIITYYWIPSGGSGVQRWVKFIKYLRNFGWEPIVYAPENPDYPLVDESFSDDIPADIQVIKRKIWEPYRLYRKFSGNKSKAIQTGFVIEKEQLNWKDKFSIWLRGNLFIPDARVFWVRPSIRYLKKYLKNNSVDAIVTTGPPHSVHLIGQGLKHEFPHIPWIADFRDPWTSIFYYKDLKLTRLADKVHQGLEKKVVQTADMVLVVSDFMKNEFENYVNRKIEVLPNGFDAADFPQTKVALEDKFVITHTGLLTERQNPKILWKVLKKMIDERIDLQKDLVVRLIGNIDNSILQDIESFGLQQYVELIPNVSHTEAIHYQLSSQVLLLCLVDDEETKYLIAGKIFEYLKADRPILAFGFQDGATAKIMTETKAGYMHDFKSEDALTETLYDLYEKYKLQELCVENNIKLVDQYSREHLTEKLSSMMNSLVNK